MSYQPENEMAWTRLPPVGQEEEVDIKVHMLLLHLLPVQIPEVQFAAVVNKGTRLRTVR